VKSCIADEQKLSQEKIKAQNTCIKEFKELIDNRSVTVLQDGNKSISATMMKKLISSMPYKGFSIDDFNPEKYVIMPVEEEESYNLYNKIVKLVSAFDKQEYRDFCKGHGIELPKTLKLVSLTFSIVGLLKGSTELDEE